MLAVVKLIKKLLMSSSSDINGLYSLFPPHDLSQCLLNKTSYSGGRVKGHLSQLSRSVRAVEAACLRIYVPRCCFLSHRACTGLNDPPLYAL